MANGASSRAVASTGGKPRGRYRAPSEAEQARRVAWGKMAGAKVAAAYEQLQEESNQ